jgi:hypothetical protein
MKVLITLGAQYAYAGITEDWRKMDVRLEPGRGAIQSLRETVAEMRKKAEETLERAAFIEQAANHLEAEKAK